MRPASLRSKDSRVQQGMTWQPRVTGHEGRKTGLQPWPHFRIPNPQRRVVRHPGSLTRLLRSLCREQFRVEVLTEHMGRATVDEALALDLDPRARVWIREVCLRGDDRPWVRARTVIPLASLRGRSRALRRLGSRPLGSALFGRHPWRRRRFIFGVMPDGELARRSLFCRGPHRLLVTEVFLPTLWRDVLPLKKAYNTIRMDAVRPL